MRHFVRIAVAVAMAIPAVADAASGEIAFVVGTVSLTKANGQRATPAKGMAVDPGDTVVTGADGMVQLSMVDQARLSLRPNSQFTIERYPDRRDGTEGAVLSLVKGTLRTFTGLLNAAVRDRFVMKTQVATVGIRGSGNILHSCQGSECGPGLSEGAKAGDWVTVHHTIEGSHAVTNEPGPGGTQQTLVTGPGQTVLVQGNQPPRYIRTPPFISNLGNAMAGDPTSPFIFNLGHTIAGDARPAQGLAGNAPVQGADGTIAPPRVFAPSDIATLPAVIQGRTASYGGNGLGFTVVDANGNLGVDPLGLQDVVVASAGSPFLSQATPASLNVQGFVAIVKKAARGAAARGE